MKSFVLLVALCAALPALAQSNASTSAASRAETAVQGNGVVSITNQAAPAVTSAKFETNQAASGPSVFVNPPAADTCDRAGVGISGGWVTGNAGVNIPRGQSDKCDMRADSINLKVVGAPSEVIKARHCMDAQMAEAYARAGQPCVDARESKRAEAILNGAPVAVRPQPWQAGG